MKVYGIKSKIHNLGVPRAPRLGDSSTSVYYMTGDYVAVTQEQLDTLWEGHYELICEIKKPTKRKKKDEKPKEVE